MQKRVLRYIIALALGIAFVGAAAKSAHLEEAGNTPSTTGYGSFARVLNPRLKAPGFSLKDLNGDRIEFKSLRGKVVMLNFRATW